MRSPHPSASSRLTVEDLFAESDLGLRLVAGRQGVGRQVLGVHVSEIPDPTRWINPGDVLLTTGVSIRDSEELQRRLVRVLSESGMSALGLGVGVYMHRTPAAVLEEADALGLPVFEVPFETPFKAVISFVLDSLMNRNVYLLRRRLSVQAHLLSALLEERGTDYLVSSLAVLLSATVVLFDHAGRVSSLTEKGPVLPVETVERIWEAYEPRLDDPSSDILRVHAVDRRQVLFRDVWSNGRLERVLAIVYPESELVPEFTVVIASYAQKLLSLEAMKSREAEQLWRQMRGGLLDDLVLGLGRSEDLREQAVHFGFDPALDYIVIMCAVADRGRPEPSTRSPEAKPAEMLADLEEAIGSFFSLRKASILSMIRSTTVVAAVQLGSTAPSEVRTLLEELSNRLPRALPGYDFALGGSGIHNGTEAMPRSYAEAQEALAVARREGEKERVRLFADLGPTASFLFGLEVSRLRALADAGLSELARHDQENNDSLLQTVRMYVEVDRDVREASRRLFIHPNTLRYRLRKAETLLGSSLDATRALADLYLAFRAEAMLDSLGSAAAAGTTLSADAEGAMAAPDSGLSNLLVGSPAVVLPGELAATQRRLQAQSPK